MKIARKNFYFIRHGEAAYTGDPFLDDTTDIALSQQGKIQAVSMKPIIQALSIKTICVSPLRRALETKDILSENLSCQVVVLDELRECTWSIWEKMVALEDRPHQAPCETVRHFMEQALLGINNALHHPGPVLVVAHGGIHWAICHHLKIEGHPKKIGNCIPVHFTISQNEEWNASPLVQILGET